MNQPAPIALKKASQLDAAEILDLQNLVKSAAVEDGFATKFYWQSSVARSSQQVMDFVFYANFEIIAGLSLYDFASGVEVCAIVQPFFRNQSVFTRLWQAAITELKEAAVSEVTFLVNSKSTIAINWLKKAGAMRVSSEAKLVINQPLVKNISNKNISFRAVKKAELNLVAELDVKAFASDYASVVSRYKSIFADNNRSMFFVYLNDEVIGKLHVLFEADLAYLHDICIDPAKQGNGYGKAFLQQINNHLFELGCNKIALEIDSTSPGLLSFYAACGFVIEEEYDYWKLYFGEPKYEYKYLH